MRRNTARRLSFAVTVAMTTLLSVPRDARAGANYSASTSDGGSTAGSSPVSSSGIANSNANGQFFVNEEKAVTSVGSVGAGILQTYTCCNVPPTSPTSLSVPTATAAANFTDDDVIFGTSGGGSITTSLNLHLKGFISPQLTVDALNNTNTTITASSTIMITVDITQGANFFSASGSSSESVTATDSASTTAVASSGLLANFLTPVSGNPLKLASNSDLTTGTFTVTAGSPVPVSVAFSATNQTAGTIDTGSFLDVSGSFTNFLDTLSFATDVPVFNLAAGDLVNSVEGNIVNNQYIAVPEPSTILLFGTALVSLGFIRRRRKASSSLLSTHAANA